MLFNPYANNQMPQMTPQQPMNMYPPTQPTNKLPPQQILQANGKSSVDAIQMSPNSSVLIMDSTAPIIWMCISDSLGNVSKTPYDVSLHVDKSPLSLDSIEERLVTLEDTIQKLEGKYNGKPDDSKPNTKQINAEYSPNKKHNEHNP